MRHGNYMRVCYVLREHDYKCMAVVRGWYFAEKIKQYYCEKFKEHKFIISYVISDKKQALKNGKNELDKPLRAKRQAKGD